MIHTIFEQANHRLIGCSESHCKETSYLTWALLSDSFLRQRVEERTICVCPRKRDHEESWQIWHDAIAHNYFKSISRLDHRRGSLESSREEKHTFPTLLMPFRSCFRRTDNQAIRANLIAWRLHRSTWAGRRSRRVSRWIIWGFGRAPDRLYAKFSIKKIIEIFWKGKVLYAVDWGEPGPEDPRKKYEKKLRPEPSIIFSGKYSSSNSRKVSYTLPKWLYITTISRTMVILVSDLKPELSSV